ncbi:peptidoglycan-binding protein [Halobacillus salinarum]|uniref:Peptidoglycan-binding protein n=1 Tax=Halobacillus salinarum TaxID=2932257 RepID=A0ABY4EFU8_9BACI|nr:peptidoglycan-binding protein [Halobacillus salinarum]UOQ43344.1 peptidoglycan-binding protein [Halobacillus salinarum]
MSRVRLQELKNRSIRAMGKVHKAVKEKILDVQRQAYDEGIQMQISSGFRSFEEQAQLYGKGRPSYKWHGKHYGSSGKIVTNAEPGESVHNYGFAVDFFLTSYDGQDSIWNVNDDWMRVVELAKHKGFTWGGDWTSFPDRPHLQLTGSLTWKDLQKGKRPSKSLLEVDVPVPDDGILEEGETGYQIKKLQQMLIKLGYALPKYGADGDFGEKTLNALKAFQKDHHLEVDGVAGPKTRDALEEALSLKPPKPEDKNYWYIYTGPFENHQDAQAAIKKIKKYKGWILDINHENRVMTGHFIGKNVVEFYAEWLRNEFGWTVYVSDHKPVKEEDEMPEVAVVINSAADYGVGEMLANRLETGVYTRYVAKKVQVADHLYVVGGDKEGLKAGKITLLSGKSRLKTASEVDDYLEKHYN